MPSKSSDCSEMLYLEVFWGEDVPFATFVDDSTSEFGRIGGGIP